MADTRLQFIDSNPATEAFQRGQQEASREMLAQEQIAKMQRENVEGEKLFPSRLRSAGALADTNVAGAQVATKSVPYDISARRSAADSAASNAVTAGSNARVNVATEEARISQPYSAADTARAGADVAQGSVAADIASRQAAGRIGTSNANVQEATEPTRIEQPKAHLRSTELGNQSSAAKLHLEELNLIEQGRSDVAQDMARRRGETIPPNILENEQARGFYKQVLHDALQKYPNNPRAQDAYVQGKIKGYQQPQPGQDGQTPQESEAAAAEGYRPGPQSTGPLDVHAPPPGAPELPDQSSAVHNYEWRTGQGRDPATGQIVPGSFKLDRRTGTEVFTPDVSIDSGRYGGGGKTSVFQQKQSAWLIVHPGDAQGALDYASGHRLMTGQDMLKAANLMAVKEVGTGGMLSFQPEKRKAAIAEATMRYLKMLQEQSGPGASPAPTPNLRNPPAQPPSAPSGSGAPASPTSGQPPPGAGTHDQPFQATTQDHINWFKANAQPGQVISVNGQLFTK